MKKDRTVVISGAAGGIGLAIAKAFDKQGDFIGIFDIDKTAAEKAASEMAHAKAYQTDVSSEKSVKASYKELLKERSSVDVVINNAGIQHIAPVEDFSEADWDKVIDIILKGTFLMTKHALPSMQKQNYGRVITISSGHGRRPDKYKSAYVAAKHGQIGFTNTVAMENAEKGITANSILPGPTRTNLIEKQIPELAKRDGTSEEEAVQTHLVGNQWMKRLLEPEEIAALAVFLASDGAAAITGEAYGVTGGE